MICATQGWQAVKLALRALLVPLAALASAQEPEVTFHSSSHLVLVDVIAFEKGLPIKTLTRHDFRLFDDGFSRSDQDF